MYKHFVRYVVVYVYIVYEYNTDNFELSYI